MDWVGADLYRSIATTRSKNLTRKVHEPWVLKVYLLTRSDEIFRIRRYHKDMEGLRYGIRKVRQGTYGGLDGQYKRHTHLCEVNLSYSPSLLTQAVPH